MHEIGEKLHRGSKCGTCRHRVDTAIVKTRKARGGKNRASKKEEITRPTTRLSNVNSRALHRLICLGQACARAQVTPRALSTVNQDRPPLPHRNRALTRAARPEGTRATAAVSFSRRVPYSPREESSGGARGSTPHNWLRWRPTTTLTGGSGPQQRRATRAAARADSLPVAQGPRMAAGLLRPWARPSRPTTTTTVARSSEPRGFATPQTDALVCFTERRQSSPARHRRTGPVRCWLAGRRSPQKLHPSMGDGAPPVRAPPRVHGREENHANTAASRRSLYLSSLVRGQHGPRATAAVERDAGHERRR